MIHIIKIKDNQDGVVYTIKDKYDWSEEGIDYSCDCNRFLAVERSKGNSPEAEDAVCGHSRYELVSIDGVPYYSYVESDGNTYQTKKERS